MQMIESDGITVRHSALTLLTSAASQSRYGLVFIELIESLQTVLRELPSSTPFDIQLQLPQADAGEDLPALWQQCWDGFGLRPAWVPAALAELNHALDELNELHMTLEALYERAKLLQEEIASQMSEQMNRNLMALSILTALLMPATMVSGIFGMNVAGLRGLHDEASFAMVIWVMLGLGVATVAFLKWLKIW